MRLRPACRGILLDHRGPAAVAGHVDVEGLGAVDILFDLVVVHGLVAGVEAVLEGGQAVRAGGEEVELEGEVALGAVGDAADEPLVTLALGDDDVFAGLGLQGAGFVPGGGDAGDVAGAVLVLVVARGVVAEHLDTAFQDDVQCHVEGARARPC